MSSVEQIIRRQAARRGYGRTIQDALVGIAHHESGLDPRSLGDGGTSYGLFQLHRNGGTLGSMSDAQARQYWDPVRNTNFALDHLRGLLHNGMTLDQAVSTISRQFERPANPGQEIASALAFLRGGGASGATALPSAQVDAGGVGDLGAGVDPALQMRVDAAKRNAHLLHLPFIRLPDVGGSIPFRASVDQGAVAPPPTQMGQAITAAAKHFLGIQYKWGGTSPTTGFDCSGLTQYVFAKFGVHIPRVAADQFNAGHKVSRGQAQAGDLVFFSSAAQGVHHVGIYLGNGMFLQAPHTGDVVKISKLSDRGDIAGFRRFGR